MASAGDDAELIDVAPPVQHSCDGERGTQCEEENVAEREADCGAAGPGLVATEEAVGRGYGDGQQRKGDGQNAGQLIGADRNGSNRRKPNCERSPEPMTVARTGPNGDRCGQYRARDEHETDRVEMEVGKGAHQREAALIGDMLKHNLWQ